MPEDDFLFVINFKLFLPDFISMMYNKIIYIILFKYTKKKHDPNLKLQNEKWIIMCYNI